MATRVYNTTTREVEELVYMADGNDFLFDSMANAGMELSEREDSDFELDQEEIDWWVRWAEREERIKERMSGLGEEEIEAIREISYFSDGWEEIQDKVEEFLGIGE